MWKGRVLGVMGLVVSIAQGAAWGFSVSYNQRVVSGGEVVESAVRVKDDLMRIESSSEGEQVIVLRNHEGTFSYFPEEGFAMRLSGLERNQQPIDRVEDYANFLHAQQATVIRSERVNGYDCDVYRFTDPAGEGTVTAWVWRERQFPVKVELNGSEGLTVAELTNIQLDSPVAESDFLLPPGVEVMAGSPPMGDDPGMSAGPFDLEHLRDGGHEGGGKVPPTR